MVLTIISIWVGAVTIGVAGAAAALSYRWVRVLALNVVAGIFTLQLFGSLKGDFAVALLEAGDNYLWLTMVSGLVMWGVFGAGALRAVWRLRSRYVTT